MKRLYLTYITLLLLGCVVYGDDYSLKKEFALQKDEQKKFLVKYANERKLFTLRWTLYINDVLTVLHSYDVQVGQHALQKNHVNQSFRVQLKARGIKEHNAPYLLVQFKEFDFQKNKATFALFLYNNKVPIALEEIPNK